MKALLIFVFSGIVVPLFAQHKVEITIKGIETVKGTILLAVYSSGESFMKKQVVGRKAKVSDKHVVIVVENLKPGDYAISTFHDENDNEKLDTNFVGIPKELYGFSNDAKGSFGPPSFDKAKVKIDSDKKLVITLR